MSTKIHMTTDALGRPIRFVLTSGQTNDAIQAERLLEGVATLDTEGVIADRAYDTEKVLGKVKELGALAVIPKEITSYTGLRSTTTVPMRPTLGRHTERNHSSIPPFYHLASKG